MRTISVFPVPGTPSIRTWPAGEERDQQLVQGLAVPDDDAVELLAQALEDGVEFLHRALRCGGVHRPTFPGEDPSDQVFVLRWDCPPCANASSLSWRSFNATGLPAGAAATLVRRGPLAGRCTGAPFASKVGRNELIVRGERLGDGLVRVEFLCGRLHQSVWTRPLPGARGVSFKVLSRIRTPWALAGSLGGR